MWTKETYQNLINELFNLGDPKYLEFTKKITNTNDVKMIGVKIPFLRDYAKKIAKTDLDSFLKYYTGSYFEERMILGLSIAYTNNLKLYDKYLWYFSSQITDWSICDSVANSLKLIKKNNSHFYPLIKKLLNTNNEFQVRFALIILMSQFMNDDYIDIILDICSNLKSDYYYVNMALAWVLCECYIKYQDKTKVYINKTYLSKFVLNKTISKICDSFRVEDEDKEKLKKERII